MAKKHFLFSSRLIRKAPFLRKLSWMLEAFIVRSLAALMRSMSPERATRLCHSIFRHLKPVLPFTAKIRRNLTIAFPDKDSGEIERLTSDVCGNLGDTAAELILADRIWAERDERIEFVLEEGMDFARYRGRPGILVTGHVGSWQLATFIAAEFELRVTAVYAKEENPYLRKFSDGLRAALPCEFVSRDGCMRTLMTELKQGNMIGIVPDTRLEGGDPIPFFGIPVESNTTAARLAIRHNCDLIPLRVKRLPNMRFRITLTAPIRPGNPGAPVADQAREMTQKLFEHLEIWIRDTPEQWICFGRRWAKEYYTQSASGSIDRPKDTKSA